MSYKNYKNVMRKSFNLALVIIISFLGFSNNIAAANEHVYQTNLESISVDKKEATAGDTVKVSMKVTDKVGINYIIAWYIAPVTQNTIYVHLYYNDESDAFEGVIPIQSSSESGDYILSRLGIYKTDNVVDSLYQSELFEDGNFNVSGTNGTDLIESISVDKKEATAGDTVKVSMNVNDKVGINYILAWYYSPITNNTINVHLYYNSESDSYEGNLPIQSFSEPGDYNLSRIVIYKSDNVISLQQSEFKSGNFIVNGTSGTGLIESIRVNKKEATAGDTVKVSLKVKDEVGINTIMAWYIEPDTNNTIDVYLYYNNESGLFEGNLPIDSDFVTGNYDVNRLTIYSSGVTYGFQENDNQLENGEFSIFKEENPPTFKSLSVNKNELESGESVSINLEAEDDTNLLEATINYITPQSKSNQAISLRYDSTNNRFSSEFYIDESTEFGKWIVDSIEIKDTNHNSTTINSAESDLSSGEFTVVLKDIIPPVITFVNEVTDKDTYVTGQAEAEATITVTSGTIVLNTVTVNSDGNYSVTIPKQKAGTILMVTATDAAGNTSDAKEITVKDITSPTVPTVNEITDKSINVSGTAEVGSTISVKAGTTVIGSAVTMNDGKYSVAISKQKAGTKLVVTATDGAGNTSDEKEVTVKDITAPTVPTVNEVTDKSFSVTGTAEASSTITVKAGTTVIGLAVTMNDGKYLVAISKQKAGTDLVVTATDGAGNTSDAKEITVQDITAPTVPTVNEITDKSISVSGTAEVGSTITVKN